ncbi:sigma-70 family RNA polymerase sigma factor [Fodinibius salsisoli]|uniref:Sigma-70 family RNA polymerase sigma factor n=1 Tax=Fodinibius salsisoli TaxID=2820877 RepID=A0ABT3PI40_9BACT|nr:sigma-70 family RNA polymerase sigma factor [Fodinibius salsisoli]MCW9705565.1 sigma-70 family RNA polymerase sigma factor [Fodinibius salsisoli]
MENYQNVLFPYAYNILGSRTLAQDAIQEVMAKYFSGSTSEVNNPEAYLKRAVINQSINLKKKNQKTISSEEVWLPEPVATDHTDKNIIQENILSYSLLFLLEQLNPKERAVFILKEAFAYKHKEIAEVLSCSVPYSRKLLSRARSKVRGADQSSATIPQADAPAVQIDKYLTAIRNRDLETLQSLLSEDVALYADGGEAVKVVQHICNGRPDVSDLLMYVYQKFQQSQIVQSAIVNHQPALLFYEDQLLKACQVYHFDRNGQRIKRICNILDPEKLKNID